MAALQSQRCPASEPPRRDRAGRKGNDGQIMGVRLQHPPGKSSQPADGDL